MASHRQSAPQPPSDDDYRRLLQFRSGIRRFLRWSEGAAADAGLAPAVHQLLLAIRGHDRQDGPTVSDLATHLVVRHHTAVGLVDRAEHAGFVTRSRDDEDHRIVRVQLTKEGRGRLATLTTQHMEELARMAPSLTALWSDLPGRD